MSGSQSTSQSSSGTQGGQITPAVDIINSGAPAAPFLTNTHPKVPAFIPIKDMMRIQLIFLRRYFQAVGSKWDGSISGAYREPTGQQHYTPQEQIRALNPHGTTYYEQKYFDELVKGCPEGLAINFALFQVVMSSVFYIGVQGRRRNLKNEDIKVLFRETLRRQLGGHIFMDRLGAILVMSTFIKWVHNLGTYVYTSEKMAPITAVYPVNRYEYQNRANFQDFKSLAQMRFVLGLELQMMPDDDEVEYYFGKRYYHREGEGDLRVGGVYETYLEQLDKMVIDPYEYCDQVGEWFALFVGAGAKLCVVDDFSVWGRQRGDLKVRHNRSLIQQGGFVICRCPLRYIIPHEERDEVYDRDYLNRIARNKNDFFNMLTRPNNFISMEPTLSEKDKTELAKIKNPVLFLGANYSQYNSACWVLSTDLNNYGVMNLILPEGGRILAITEGKEGLREIRARVSYENLHNSVVIPHDIPFATPKKPNNKGGFMTDFDMILRILNFDDNRSFVYRYGDYNYWGEIHSIDNDYRHRHDRPVYPEFNFMCLTKEESFRKNASSLKAFLNFPPPLPPMYPPYFYNKQMRYLPCDELTQKRDTISEIYPTSRDSSLNLSPWQFDYGPFKDNSYANLRIITGDGNFWRCRMDDQQLQYDFGRLDGYRYRIGVDGWVWQRCYVDGTFDPKTDAQGQAVLFENAFKYKTLIFKKQEPKK